MVMSERAEFAKETEPVTSIGVNSSSDTEVPKKVIWIPQAG